MLEQAEKDYLANLQDYKNVFESPSGKKVLYDLMKANCVLTSTFSKDPYETVFKEGCRNTVLTILNILNMDIKALEQEIRERVNNERAKRNQYRI